MADYHNPADVKFMIDSKLIKKPFRQQVFDLFRASKNIRYVESVLTNKYAMGQVVKTRFNEYKAYQIFVKSLTEKIFQFRPDIINRAYFDDKDIWTEVRSLNFQFIKSAKEQIGMVTSYKPSKSYLQKEFEVNCLFPKGFESLNAGVKFGMSGGEDDAWDEGDANMTAEETTAEYYGMGSVTSDVAIKLRRKLEKRPSKLKIEGTPFMINMDKRINMRYNPARAPALQERGIQRPAGMEDTYEVESRLYRGVTHDKKAYVNPFSRR
jgi:hypothetical protein